MAEVIRPITPAYLFVADMTWHSSACRHSQVLLCQQRSHEADKLPHIERLP